MVLQLPTLTAFGVVEHMQLDKVHIWLIKAGIGRKNIESEMT